MNNDTNSNKLTNFTEYDSMLELTDSDSKVAEMHTSEESNLEVQKIEETAVWVQLFLANLPQLGEQLTGSHRSSAININFMNDST